MGAALDTDWQSVRGRYVRIMAANERGLNTQGLDDLYVRIKDERPGLQLVDVGRDQPKPGSSPQCLRLARWFHHGGE